MKYIIIIIVLLSNIACKSTEKNNIKMEELLPTEQVAKTKQYRYYIGIGVYLPFELYLNDILIKYGTTGVSSGVELNPWLLYNGKHKITIKFFPDVGGETVVNMSKEQLPYRIDFSRVVLTDNRDIVEAKELANLPLVTTNEDLPYFKQSWEIEVKNLPYELEGWSNGQDLSKWNKDLLQKKVIAYYEKLRTILNNGDADAFNELCLLWDKETNIFNYDYDKEKIREKFEKNSRKIREKCKGNMMPLEDFTMKIYGKNNQLVTLERNPSTHINGYEYNVKGWSPLIRKYKISGGVGYPVKLFLPKGSNEFVIIRK